MSAYSNNKLSYTNTYTNISYCSKQQHKPYIVAPWKKYLPNSGKPAEDYANNMFNKLLLLTHKIPPQKTKVESLMAENRKN